MRDEKFVQQQEMRKRRQDLEEMNSTIKEQQEEKDKYKTKINQLTCRLKSARQGKETMKKERDMLQIDVNDFKTDTLELNKTIEDQGLQIQNLLQTINELKSCQATLQMEMKRSSADTENYKRRCSLSERVESQGQVLMDQRTELEDKNNQLKELKRSKIHLQEELTNLESDPLGRCIQLQQLIAQAEDSLRLADAKLTQLRSEIKRALEQQLDSLS